MMRKSVELQDYALHALGRDCPCIRRDLGVLPSILPLKACTATEIDLAFGRYTIRFRCPEKLQGLFIRKPGEKASPRVVGFLREAHETWTVEHQLVRVASCTRCTCEKCKFEHLRQVDKAIEWD